MTPFEKCPICGGELATKKVEKLLRGGGHTAVLSVTSEVCLRCGERLYSQDVVKQFNQIRHKLEQEDTEEFQPIGRSFRVG